MRVGGVPDEGGRVRVGGVPDEGGRVLVGGITAGVGLLGVLVHVDEDGRVPGVGAGFSALTAHSRGSVGRRLVDGIGCGRLVTRCTLLDSRLLE